MKKIIYFELTLILIIGCSSDEYLSEKAKISELDSIDYEIISAALDVFLSQYKTGSFPEEEISFPRETFGNSKAELLLILDSTYIEYISDRGKEEHKSIDTSDTYLTDRLSFENRRKHPIDNNRITTFDTKLLTDEDVDYYENSLFGAYKYLYKKYPEAWGVIGFSKPSYDINGTKAVIYLKFSKHYKWAKSAYIWLKKENGKWILYDTIMLSIS